MSAIDGVIRMPAMSRSQIEVLASMFLQEVAPSMLGTIPTRLDVATLVDDVLPRYGIHVYPASATELRGNEGLTDPSGQPRAPIDILIHEDQFEALTDPGPRGNRARCTVLHELAHALLHVPVIRRRCQLPSQQHTLLRVSDSAIKIYENPEWQAYAFAGHIAMPRGQVLKLPTLAPEAVARFFGVSQEFARQHLKRCGLLEGPHGRNAYRR